MSTNWYVYMIRCADNSLYTGVTTDVERRLYEHNYCNKSGARYTRGRRPVELEYMEMTTSRSTACKRESDIKSMTKSAKEKLLCDVRVKKNRGRKA